jgi:hypothetical protein
VPITIDQTHTESLAKARLAQLMDEGVVTGLGVGRWHDRDIVFVAINDQLLSSQHAELNTLRARLKDALQDIPFDVLGHYDESPTIPDATIPDTVSPVAAFKATAQRAPLLQERDGVTSRSTDAPPQHDVPTQIVSRPVSSLTNSEDSTGDSLIDPEVKTVRPAPNTLAAVLLLAAAVGWGAFVYSVISARAQQRAYQDEISRVTADRDKLSTELNQARGGLERNGLALERVQEELVSARAQLQASPPQTSRDEMRRVVADRDKLNAELNQQRAEAERNQLALERAQAELASARAQSQTSSAPPAPQVTVPSPVPPVRARPVR